MPTCAGPSCVRSRRRTRWWRSTTSRRGAAPTWPALDRVELVEGSILDPVLLDSLFEDADAVVHLAARPSVPRSLADPMASHRRPTPPAPWRCWRPPGAVGRPHVVVASSSSVYGANPALPKREDMATMPVSPYAASKLAAESAHARLRPLLRPAGAGLPLLQRLRSAAGRRPRLRGRRPHLRGRAHCGVIRCRSTATGARPATSPTWEPWPRYWPGR